MAKRRRIRRGCNSDSYSISSLSSRGIAYSSPSQRFKSTSRQRSLQNGIARVVSGLKGRRQTGQFRFLVVESSSNFTVQLSLDFPPPSLLGALWDPSLADFELDPSDLLSDLPLEEPPSAFFFSSAALFL